MNLSQNPLHITAIAIFIARYLSALIGGYLHDAPVQILAENAKQYPVNINKQPKTNVLWQHYLPATLNNK